MPEPPAQIRREQLLAALVPPVPGEKVVLSADTAAAIRQALIRPTPTAQRVAFERALGARAARNST